MPVIPGTNKGLLGKIKRIDDWRKFERDKAAASFWYWQAESGAYPALEGVMP